MNKMAIKNYAVRARRRLIEEVSHKAYEVGITKDKVLDIETFDGGFKVKGRENGKTFKKYEKKQRDKLIEQIKYKGFEQVVEEVAYTWFNRFIALRFMEVNNYLPTGVRVLSSMEEGKAEPDIISEALNIDLEVDQNIVYRLQDSNDTEDLYKYLLIRQCNELGKIMPTVFEEIADYTELLLPDKLLVEGSVIRDLVESIEEYDWKIELVEEEQKLEAEKGEHGIEIIGWLYQYYISEKKDEVFAGLRKNKKITKENIPAATQLFTPKWIVKYMVENSLGRLWVESHPNEDLKAGWKYYLEEAKQEPEVQKQLDALKNPDLNPEDIKVLDPAMGSGHILVYAFDVLYDIYLSAGYSEREIPNLILEKNLYGLDIDDRAGQLACFALLMKARSRNRRIFKKKPKLNLCSIQESNGIPKEAIEYLVDPRKTELENYTHREEAEYLISVFHDAKEYGSILEVKEIDFDALERRIEELRKQSPGDVFEYQYSEVLLDKVPPLIQQARIMSQKYDVVCTNPPYLGNKGMNSNLYSYLAENFQDTKMDLYTVFIDRCSQYIFCNKFFSMVTQQGWMFLTSYMKMRERIMRHTNLYSLIHLGARTFEEISGEVVQSACFIIRNSHIDKLKSTFIRLVEYNCPKLKQIEFHSKANYYEQIVDNILKIDGSPLSYWLSDNILKMYKKHKKLKDISETRQGLKSSDDKRFFRVWYEVSINKITYNIDSHEASINSGLKWFPLNKGGSLKWYGENLYLVNWYKDGQEIKAYASKLYKSFTRTITSIDYYFIECITWPQVTMKRPNFRLIPQGFIFNAAGPSLFPNDTNDLKYILGLLNSKVAEIILMAVNPTINFCVGDILKIIYIKEYGLKERVEKIVNICIRDSRINWDSFETSWDFQLHPLLTYKKSAATIEEAFNNWSAFAEQQFNQLKQNEEELNRIFIDIYGLQDELTPEVEDKDITISKADRGRDIKSFISYAVGCMFGRYSLDEDGLIYAGGDFGDKFRLENGSWEINTKESWEKSSVAIAKDNVIPIADGDYFEDDILERFVEFVRVSFGDKDLAENLEFIAETLGKKLNETSRQAIRRYFLKDFYKDHVKTYKKRPIYWLFDSGRQNGFKALIYMHRYDPFTVARVRTDYLHKLQLKYEAEVRHLDILIGSNISDREKVQAKKRKEVVLKQMQECRAYDQTIAHVADQKIDIDLDDGVKVNHAKLQGVEIPMGEGKKPLKADLLAKI